MFISGYNSESLPRALRIYTSAARVPSDIYFELRGDDLSQLYERLRVDSPSLTWLAHITPLQNMRVSAFNKMVMSLCSCNQNIQTMGGTSQAASTAIGIAPRGRVAVRAGLVGWWLGVTA